jgi:hypothetical protein
MFDAVLGGKEAMHRGYWQECENWQELEKK